MKLKTWHEVKNNLPASFEYIEPMGEGHHVLRDLESAQYELYFSNSSTRGMRNCIRYKNTSLEFAHSLPDYSA